METCFNLKLDTFGGILTFTSNLSKKDTAKIIKVSDSFIKEILSDWSEVNFEECITSKSQFLELSLWHNSLIRINDRPIFYKEWYKKGIKKVKLGLYFRINTTLNFVL